MGNATEVRERQKYGEVEILAEWSYDLNKGCIIIKGDADSEIVVLGAMDNDDDLRVLFWEVSDLFERMHRKKILTFGTI